RAASGRCRTRQRLVCPLPGPPSSRRYPPSLHDALPISVTAVRPAADGGYEVATVRTGGKLRRRRRVYHADQVVFAAGALGTQRLLHAMKASGALPHLSDRLGTLTRTNSEAILGASLSVRAARRRGVDYSRGAAITSSFHPDP